MNRKTRRFFVGSIVKHFKGKIYRIEDFARHTEDGDMLVIYRQMFPPYMLMARPEPIFCSRVDREKYPDAEQEFRFEKLTETDARDLQADNPQDAAKGAEIGDAESSIN